MIKRIASPFRLFCLLLAGWMLVFTTPAPVHAEETGKNNLTIAMTQYPSTLHPLIDSMAAKSYVLGMTARPLTAYDKNWQQTCLFCEKLPTLENGLAKIETRDDGSQGIAATYTLPEQAVWGDGTPITVEDILFAWEVGKHPQSGVSNFELFANDIMDITKVDDKTFTVHFDKVTCEFSGISDFYVLPAHLERDIFEKDPKTYKERTLYATNPTHKGLWFGPYVLKSQTPGAALTLARNPLWWGKTPDFDTITIRIIENTAALTAALLSGDVDYISGELGLTLDQALPFEKRLKAQKPDQYKVIYKPSLVYEHIDINLDNPVWQDVKMRQALLLGINRQAISQSLFDGRQPVALSNISALDDIHTGDVDDWSHDPEQAKKLLDEAGWKTGDDGYRYNDKGEKLSFTLMTTAGNKSRELIQQAIQADWKKIGIDTTINNEPARVLFGQTTTKRKFKDGVMYAWMSAPKNIPRTTLHSDMIPTEANNYAGQNYPGYKNAEMDKILEDLEVVCEPDKNRALWTRLQQLYTRDLPALPLYYRANPYIIPVWLDGIEPTGHMNPTTLWIEDWSRTE